MVGSRCFLAALVLVGCPEREPTVDLDCSALADGEAIPFERVTDPYLGCVEIETDDAPRLVFATATEWESFWQTHVKCWSGTDPMVPTPAPVFNWEDAVLVGVFTCGNCCYSGCSDELLPLITHVGYGNGAVRFVVRDPTRDELGTCLACMQPRDFVRVDRRLHQCHRFEFE